MDLLKASHGPTRRNDSHLECNLFNQGSPVLNSMFQVTFFFSLGGQLREARCTMVLSSTQHAGSAAESNFFHCHQSRQAGKWGLALCRPPDLW